MKTSKMIKGTSYNIISYYDPHKLGLIQIAQNVIVDFLKLVGIHASIQTLECKGDSKLVSKWEEISEFQKNKDGDFSCRVIIIYREAAKLLSSYESYNGILVTGKDIGNIVGWTVDSKPIAIVSYDKIKKDPATFATGIFHELGHMHGIPSSERQNTGQLFNDVEIINMEKEMRGKDAICKCLGEHCLNAGCSMRQRLCFKNWSCHLTKERLQTERPYCDKCLDELKEFFKKRAK